jgi:hypothetical protein
VKRVLAIAIPLLGLVIAALWAWPGQSELELPSEVAEAPRPRPAPIKREAPPPARPVEPAPPKESTAPTASVSGTVRDASSRQAIPGARVSSAGAAAVADHAGRFLLQRLPPGELWIEARARGYRERLEGLALAGARDHSGLELFLQPAALIHGTVIRGGHPVAGAPVWAEGTTTNTEARSAGPVHSDAQGRFTLEVDPGPLQLSAAAPGGSRVDGPRVIAGAGAPVEGVQIELGEAAAVEGRVTLDGEPRDGVALTLLDSRTERPVAHARSEGDGSFRFEALAEGAYLVQARVDATVAQRGPFQTGSQSWEVKLDSGPSLLGQVLPPGPGIKVRFRSSDWAGTGFAETLTAVDGSFRFDGVPPGELIVEAEGPAGAARATARAGGERLLLTLRPSALEGLVLDSRGQPVNDFTVRLTPLEGGPTRGYPVLSPSGDFKLAVPPGRYRVTATAPGHGEAAEAPEVDLGTRSVKLQLLPAIPARGRVSDAQTGAPLAGVEVVFNRMGRHKQRWAGRWATLLTGANGDFELGAAPVDAVLAFRRRGYASAWVALDRMPRDAAGTLIAKLQPTHTDAREGGPYDGIGAQLSDAGGGITVGLTFEGSPAEAAAVDGVPVAGKPLGEVIRGIVGPAGTRVRLDLTRDGKPLVLHIRRRTIQL